MNGAPLTEFPPAEQFGSVSALHAFFFAGIWAGGMIHPEAEEGPGRSVVHKEPDDVAPVVIVGLTTGLLKFFPRIRNSLGPGLVAFAPLAACFQEPSRHGIDGSPHAIITDRLPDPSCKPHATPTGDRCRLSIPFFPTELCPLPG